MLASGYDAAVLDLEYDAAVDVQAFAVPEAEVVVKSDDAAVLVREHGLQLGLERPAGLLQVFAELREDGVAPLVVAGKDSPARRVPRRILVEQFGEQIHVGRIESVVCAADDFSILMHGNSPGLFEWVPAASLQPQAF